MRKIKAIFNFVLVLYLLTVMGCASINEPSDYRMLFYRITNDAGDHLYLFGTVHVGNQEIYPMREVIETAFNESDILVVEVNILNYSANDVNQTNYPIKNLGLDDEMVNQIEEIFANVDVQTLSAFSLMAMLEYRAAANVGLLPSGGMDIYWLNQAQRLGKPIIEIESFDRQMALFDYLDANWSYEILDMLIDVSFEQAMEDARFLYDSVLSGNEEDLRLLITPEDDASEFSIAFYQAIVVERDLEMFAEIESYFLDDYIYFIAVGAGHLVGEEGLLELLRMAGYTVEQL